MMGKTICMDWDEAGVSRKSTETWWAQHQQAASAHAQQPTAQQGAEPTTPPLVMMTFCVGEDGSITSDVQTHDRSYSDVARGFGAVRDELQRVFRERHNCPHYPTTPEDAARPIPRAPGVLATLTPLQKKVLGLK